jgi:hypothetical protein
MRKAWPAVAAALIAGATGLPAQAQRATPASGAAPGQQPLMLQSPPADIAMPPGYDPRLGADRFGGTGDGCNPAWPCRLQLFGVIDRNGGVGLKGTALTW